MLRVARNDAEGNNIAFKGLDVVRQYDSKFFKTAESGVDKVVSSCEKSPSVHWRYMNFLRQRKTALDAPLYAVSAGRSMIEMLGVLAIVGVLSVGGIAGYSKAMEKYKINKTINEYTMLITGLIEYKNNFIKNSAPQSNIDLDEFIFATNLVPQTWKRSGSKLILDSNGHDLRIYFSNKSLTEGYINPGKYVLDLHFSLNKTDSTFSKNLCKTFFIDIGQQMASQMIAMAVIPTSQNTEYAGDAFCHGTNKSVTTNQPLKCLRNITLTEVNEICHTCTNNACGIVFVF